MITKEYCIEKYRELQKAKPNQKIMRAEFLSYADIDERKLSRLFGDNPFSKLQEECGDKPNRLDLDKEAIPFEQIMRQYGDLAIEILNSQGRLPVVANWESRDLRPTAGGIRVVHGIKWSEMPDKFRMWVEEYKVLGYEFVIDNINKIDSSKSKTDIKSKNNLKDEGFRALIDNIRSWSPARRRNSEAEYKIELRKHLETKYKLNEEYGQSNYDLLVNDKFPIETKKSPDLQDYDRLFGQLARHLQHQSNVIVVIFDVPRNDQYENFLELTDKYLNNESNVVEIIKK